MSDREVARLFPTDHHIGIVTVTDSLVRLAYAQAAIDRLTRERDEARAESSKWRHLVETNAELDALAARRRERVERLALKAPQPPQASEPVATILRGPDTPWGHGTIIQRWEAGARALPAGEHKVYATPQAMPESRVPLTSAQANHLRRLLGWAACEVGQSPDEMVQGVRALAAQGLETNEEGKARLLQAHQAAANVPKYIRDAIKALRATIATKATS